MLAIGLDAVGEFHTGDQLSLLVAAIEAAFRFLLDREPKEAIPPSM